MVRVKNSYHEVFEIKLRSSECILNNKNKNVHKVRRMTKRTRIRRVTIRDNKIFLSNNIATLDEDFFRYLRSNLM